MRVLTTIAEFRRARAELAGASLGFVPTMGFLHEGHLELVRRARAENDVVAASIFVNPLQFGPAEDFESYPKDPERDCRLLEAAGCGLLLSPDVSEMYPAGGGRVETTVVPGRIGTVLEGASRPGFFTGVATVVAKLFNIVQPDRAYFGQKDGQQAEVIRQTARDLDFPVEIVVVPTVREDDGLAMSSRNTYLDPEQRAAAVVLYRALSAASDRFTSGERRADVLREAMVETLAREPLAVVDYVSVADRETLEEVSSLVERDAMASLAVRVGVARLIDNVVLTASRGSS